MSNPEERACMRKVGPDCKHLTTALHYWCSNKAACKYNGTMIPGFINCPYYKPEEDPPWSEFWYSLTVVGFTIVMSWIVVILLFSLGTLL